MAPINLALVVLEFVFRAGYPTAENLQKAYGQEIHAPTIYGISVLFHPGWDVDQLARAGHFRHNQISFATVDQLHLSVAALQKGWDVALHPTPSTHLPDHHTLSIMQGGIMLTTLPDAAAQALSAVFMPNTVRNPYQAP